MGLIVTATEQKTIKVKGLNINLESCYVRLRGFFLPNGKDMEIQCDSYHSKENYSSNEMIPIQFQSTNEEGQTIHDILNLVKCTVATDEVQSVVTCHKYAKLAFEQLGYTVVSEVDI